MKKIVSYLIALMVVAVACTGVTMLIGQFDFQEAIILGFSSAVAGALAPVVVKWINMWIVKR